MKRRSFLCLITILTLVLMLVSCKEQKKEQKKELLTLTLWHVYGAQTDSPLNSMIEKFNETVGKEKGINIQVTSISNTNTIHSAVLAADRDDPGASQLPDMFVAYPKTVMALKDKNILVDYKDYFSEEELAQYLPEFIEEGYVEDRLVVFPIAKSTEILFINKTLFDRFSAETGVKVEDLNTWEGLFKAAKIYTEWTDEQTPNTAGDGKTFFVHDYHFNYFQVGVESLGESFFNKNDPEGSIVFGDTFKRAWEPYADAAISGALWLKEGYATEPLRTGNIIVSVASSASVLYYEDIVTYDNNVSEPIEVISRPVPIFEGGEKLVMQRGAGICMLKSTSEKEKAAAVFLKWITEPENNVEFATKTGYMPVTKKAFEILPEKVKELENPKYRSLYEALAETQNTYRFLTAPQLPNYLDLEVKFEKNVRLELERQKKGFFEAKKKEEAAAGSEKMFEEQAYINIQSIMK